MIKQNDIELCWYGSTLFRYEILQNAHDVLTNLFKKNLRGYYYLKILAKLHHLLTFILLKYLYVIGTLSKL